MKKSEAEEGKRKSKMTVAEAGRKGGQKGGRRTAETHGREFYEQIGSKGGHRVRELIHEGKEHENE